MRLKRHFLSASTISVLVAVLMTDLLRDLLNIRSRPFDPHSGWLPQLGWCAMFFAFWALSNAVIRFFRPIAKQGPDPYTLAQAEIEAERAVRSEKNHEQKTPQESD